MALVPIRNIGSTGVNTDWATFDLPITTFTMGKNVRFVNNHIRRGPIVTTVGNITLNTSPQFCLSYKLPSQTAVFLIANSNGSITNYQANIPGTTPVETNVSPTGFIPNDSNYSYTATINNGNVYVNRGDRVPWVSDQINTQFFELPNWPSTWRCQSLRSTNGVLVALNITDNGTNYPTMIRTSDFTSYGNVPVSWDYTDTTNSATENILDDLQEPLIDAYPLRDRLILFSNNETWVMEYRGDALMFNYKRIYSNRGVINANCVAEYANLHYVFGFDDIWTHDGYQNKSIAIGRVRDFIYSNLIRQETSKCFVVNNPKQNEVMFCYVSNDEYCYFPPYVNGVNSGCNRAAVYNYNNDTWYFYDLPYVVSSAFGIAFSGANFNNLDVTSLTYDSVGGTFNTFFDPNRLYLNIVCSGASLTQGTLYPSVNIFEAKNIAAGNGIINTVATAPVLIENRQLDLDEIAKELRGYKVVNQMWPEGSFETDAPPMTFTWGSSDYPNVDPVYDHSMTFDGNTYSKLDFNAPGRYLSLKIEYTGYQDFFLSGFDIDYQLFGHR